MDEELLMLPTKTYRVLNGRIAGFIDDLEAIAQTVDKILSTSRFQYLIYSDDYGSDFLDLIGEDKDLVYSEIERMTVEALSIDERITDVTVTDIIEAGRSEIKVLLTVTTIYGDLQVAQEVTF